MKNEKKTKTTHVNYERIFKIKKVENTIDLSGSLSIINNEASEKYFENEIFQITFSTDKKNKAYKYNLITAANECFCEKEKYILKKTLGITIDGCGAYFKILKYVSDFSIQFDQKKSVFINSTFVKNGLVYFKKESSNQLNYNYIVK